uniref:Alternative protein LRP1B n=1 Tax=Homo sapiens TaxID=9606 RepID=L8ECI0_HUMAN|nr:alternative protein LRP1B [Homo sapiens]
MEFMTVWMAVMKRTVKEEEIYVELMSSFAIILSANYISGCVMERTTVETTLMKPLICVSNFFVHPRDLTDAEITEYAYSRSKCAMGLMNAVTIQMKITVVVS